MRSVLGSFIFFLLTFALAGAQITGPVSVTAPAQYEGQKVAEVELISNPRINVGAYRHLVSQNSGDPYSTSKVQASLDALLKAGRFRKVEIEVQPEAAGMKLSFILQPAFYYGLLRFPGAEKHFA